MSEGQRIHAILGLGSVLPRDSESKSRSSPQLVHTSRKSRQPVAFYNPEPMDTRRHNSEHTRPPTGPHFSFRLATCPTFRAWNALSTQLESAGCSTVTHL